MAAPRSVAQFVVLAAAALVAGCAATPTIPPAGGDCGTILEAIDHAAGAAGVRDGAAARIEGFPALRVNRFLASYAGDQLDPPALREWIERLAGLGTEGRDTELANLPRDARGALEAALSASGLQRLERLSRTCAAELVARDLDSPARQALLRERARVPDDYDTWKRVAGLYWITRIAFANGIRHWHDEVRDTFARPLASLAAESPRVAYAPPVAQAGDEAVDLLAMSKSSALRIPDPAGPAAETLYRRYAPTFVVGRASDADDPGQPGWIDGAPGTATRAAVIYRRMSHARRGDDALLQIEYGIWFPERPLSAGFDLLGGRLDAVLWRVTLAPDGEPWVYDTIHACGCYHLFFPTARAGARPAVDTLDEQAFAPQALGRIAAGAPYEVWIEAGTHYVQRIVPGESGLPKVRYRFRDDAGLASIALADGTRRSLFRPDGIVEGTERGERWLFWPMGIREPGAMRQWGRHPTAFVGRRHFDDPRLIPEYFELH